MRLPKNLEFKSLHFGWMQVKRIRPAFRGSYQVDLSNGKTRLVAFFNEGQKGKFRVMGESN